MTSETTAKRFLAHVVREAQNVAFSIHHEVRPSKVFARLDLAAKQSRIRPGN